MYLYMEEVSDGRMVRASLFTDIRIRIRMQLLARSNLFHT